MYDITRLKHSIPQTRRRSYCRQNDLIVAPCMHGGPIKSMPLLNYHHINILKTRQQNLSVKEA